jgi:DNA-binding IclR family transcriptional regulator
MAHHKQKSERNVIKVRWNGSSYNANLDGERTSSTAAPIIAARRLAAKVLNVPLDEISLHTVEEDLNGISKYEIFGNQGAL